MAGTLGRDGNAFYSALLRADISGGRPVARPVVDGSTIINGLLVSVRTFSEIGSAEDVRLLLATAKLYARHLIELNDGKP